MAMKVLASPGCTDGNCPTFWVDTARGVVRVRGYDPADPTVERDVDIPIPTWEMLVAQLPARR